MKYVTFCPINMQSWPMAQSFYYYTQIAPTTYTINVDMNVTALRGALKENGYKFFPVYVYLVSRAIARQKELKVGIKEGVLGYWDSLTPAYPQFHEDDKTVSLLWTQYNADFKSFYESYCADVKKYGSNKGILTLKGKPLPNSYIISCIPWFTFHSFSLYNHGIKDYYFPSFEAGGFFQKEGQVYMPLSVTVHHATVEGYHLKVFFEELQRTMYNIGEWFTA